MEPVEIFASHSRIGRLKIQSEPDPLSEGVFHAFRNEMSHDLHVTVQLPLPELVKLNTALTEYITEQKKAAQPKELAPDERGWFQLRIIGWGKMAYWGTRKEAGKRAREKAEWEGSKAYVKRLHDNDPQVLEEIESMRKFYQARGLPNLDLTDPDSVREHDAYRKNLLETTSS